MPGACCAVRSAAWRQKQRPPCLVLGPLRWWFKVSQLSTAAGSVSTGMELSASSSYVWVCCSAGLLGLSLERKYISHNSRCAYNSAREDAHVGSVSKWVRWQNVQRYCMFTCQNCRYFLPGPEILVCLLPPHHLFSVLSPHSQEWSLDIQIQINTKNMDSVCGKIEVMWSQNRNRGCQPVFFVSPLSSDSLFSVLGLAATSTLPTKRSFNLLYTSLAFSITAALALYRRIYEKMKINITKHKNGKGYYSHSITVVLPVPSSVWR